MPPLQLPDLSGYRMPAESGRHERTIMAFPCREEQWGDLLDDGRRAWAEVAMAIAAYEPVTMVAKPGQGDVAASYCGERVDVVELPIDDAWARDTGPIYVIDDRRSGLDRRIAVDFAFNAWGGKFEPFADDDRLADRWAEHARHRSVRVPMVLEGGSITVDGAGTLITTEQCLLNPNRNPDLDRAEIEMVLRSTLGVETVVWIPWSIDDRDTDGHVDLVAMFIEPGRVLWQHCNDETDREFHRLAVSRRCLRGTPDAGGRPLELVELDVLPYVDVRGQRLPVPYGNLYLCNGAVIVPVTGHPYDSEAVAIIGSCWPDREVVTVPGDLLAFGGGGPHCITQQVPAVD